MKQKLFLVLCVVLSASGMRAQTTINVPEAGTLKAVLQAVPYAVDTITSLTVTGTLDARDFKCMRDDMTKLAVIDLSGVNIAGYTGREGTATSTTTDTTYPADELPLRAFYFSGNSNTRIKSLTLPESITVVGGYSVGGCRSLQSITIPQGVTIIKQWAFQYCENMQVAPLPASLETIERSAFYSVKKITSDIFSNVTALRTIGGDAFYGCTAISGDFMLPASLESLGHSAFDNTKITSVTLPASLTDLSAGNPFTNSKTLTEITVSSGNTRFKSVDNVLYNMAGDSLICYPGGKTEPVFDIPASVKYISARAFYYNTNLESLYIPATVERTGQYAFSFSKWKKIAIAPGTVINLDDCAFYACYDIVSADIMDISLTGGSSMFYSTSTLPGIILPANITAIPSSFLSRAYLMNNLIISNRITSIGNSAFYDCRGMTAMLVDRETAPTVSNVNTFGGTFDKSACTVYVPKDTISFATRNNWGGFKAYKSIEDNLSIDVPSSVTVPPSGATDTLDFTVKDGEEVLGFALAASTEAGWITLKSTPEGKISYIAQANSTGSERSAVITVQLYNVRGTVSPSATFTVTQEDNGTTFAPQMENAVVNAYVNNGVLCVSGIEANTEVKVYNMQGALLYKLFGENNTLSVKLPAPGIYLVQAGAVTTKVVY